MKNSLTLNQIILQYSDKDGPVRFDQAYSVSRRVVMDGAQVLVDRLEAPVPLRRQDQGAFGPEMELALGEAGAAAVAENARLAAELDRLNAELAEKEQARWAAAKARDGLDAELAQVRARASASEETLTDRAEAAERSVAELQAKLKALGAGDGQEPDTA